MAGLFSDPIPQFLDSTPNVYSGGTLNFYATGTSTPLAVYSDKTLSTSLGSTVTLNSAGRPSTQIFLANAAYKVILKNSVGTTIWTADPVYASDYSTQAKFRSYNGNPNGNVAGTAGSASTDADAVWDYANSVLYICTTTGVAAAAVWTAINAAATDAVPTPQGRLTLTSAAPVTVTDVTAATAIYYTPHVGNQVPLYTGVLFSANTFTELTLSLASQHLTNTNYDVFAFLDGATLRIGTGPAWSSATARGSGAGTTELTRLLGYLVNTNAMTMRNGSSTYSVDAQKATYLGTFRTGSAGQTEDSKAKRFLWNAYNRRVKQVLLLEATASWTYTTSTYRQANGSTSNQIAMVRGLDTEDAVMVSLKARAINSTASYRTFAVGIGLDSTTIPATDGRECYGAWDNAAGGILLIADYAGYPGLGYHYLAWLESGGGSDTTTWYGQSFRDQGLSGWVLS